MQGEHKGQCVTAHWISLGMSSLYELINSVYKVKLYNVIRRNTLNFKDIETLQKRAFLPVTDFIYAYTLFNKA